MIKQKLDTVSTNLATQIKKTIRQRILICFLLGTAVVGIITANDILNSWRQLQTNLEAQCKSMASFVISQTLIENEASIQPKLDEQAHQVGITKFYWDNKSSAPSEEILTWKFPFIWTYSYPIKYLDGTKLGAFVITGSLFYEKALFSALLTNIILLLIFFLILFIVLYPLGHSIPDRLFVRPINDLLFLLRNGKNNTDSVELSSMANEIREIKDKITSLLEDVQKITEQAEKDEAKKMLGAVAAQVVHDIRSPLASLNTNMKALPQIPEAQRIAIRNALNNINDIANNLLAQHKGLPADQAETYKIWLLAPLIESTISEKRVNLDENHIELDSEITDAGFAAFAKCDSNQIKRILSNLINNAVEAFDSGERGHITVTLDATKSNVEIAVIDNGAGIPPEHLAKILKGTGNTTKESGNGIGLMHAKEMIESWGGDFVLTSKVGEGTKVTLSLPPAKAPDWFVSEIRVSSDVSIGILDDYDSVHDAWKQRLSEVSKDLQIYHFGTSQSFIDWYQSQVKPVQVFSDYELLGDTMTGLEVLEKLELGKNALLVTSHYENPDILERCQKRGIRLLPKNLLAHVPITATSSKKKKAELKRYDLVLFDDNTEVCNAWEISASMHGKDILIFNHLDDFEEALPGIDPATPIYIDSELEDGLKGEEYAKNLFDQGYAEIYLATGHDASHFGPLPWIKAIVSKLPPF